MRREYFLKRRLNRRSVIILYSHSVLLALYAIPQEDASSSSSSSSASKETF